MIGTVELTPDVVDFGDTATHFVTGIARVSRISPGVVRVSYYTERSDGEKSITLDVLWDAQAFFSSTFEAQHAARILELASPHQP